MNETPQTHGLFAELLEGAKALAERPDLIGRANVAEAQVKALDERLDTYRQKFDELTATAETYKEMLAKAEADLAQATFREEQVRSKFEMLVDTFKGVIGDAAAAVELVSPTPEVAPNQEPTPTTQDDGTGYPELHTPSISTEFTSSQFNLEQPQEAARGPDGPFASSTDATSLVAEPTTPGYLAPPSTPALQREYWEKPDDMTWKDWAQKHNGRLAPWVSTLD